MSHGESAAEGLMRARVGRLFQFPRAFNEKRHPIVTDVARYHGHRWWLEIPKCDWVTIADFADPGGDETDDAEAGGPAVGAQPVS